MGGDNSKPQGPWQIKVEERLTQVEADTKDNKAKINDLTKNLNDNAQRWKKHLDKFDCNSTPA
jgi:septation ring formation regulator EzrA